MTGSMNALGPRQGRWSRFQPNHARLRQEVKSMRSKNIKKMKKV
jgi:hypothetical protein